MGRQLLPSQASKSLPQQVGYSATTDQIHIRHKEPKNEYQHSYLHWNYTILTSWQCLFMANHILWSHSVHDGNAFVSNALLAQGSSLFFFSKRILHWRWQCFLNGVTRCMLAAWTSAAARTGWVLMFPQIPQICRGNHPSSPSLLFPSIRLCSGTSHPRCPARTTGVSSRCLEVSLTAMRQ